MNTMKTKSNTIYTNSSLTPLVTRYFFVCICLVLQLLFQLETLSGTVAFHFISVPGWNRCSTWNF